MAGGFTINRSKLNEFKKFITNKNKNISLNNKKYYLDSIISPSALNLNFLKKLKNYHLLVQKSGTKISNRKFKNF